MSEKANHESQAPPSYQYPANTAPLAEQGTQQAPTQPGAGAEIQLQNFQPQQPASSPHQQAHGPWNPDPHMYPPQKYAPAPQPSQYPIAVPLHALQRVSQAVDCPFCHQREMTRIEAVNGSTTHGWAALLCCCACVGCIPYLMATFKDMNHSCGKCGNLLATYHGSGHVVVHQQQVPQPPK
ncbi:LITAF-like zinc ribbon domain-containing protein [Aspergillus aurantiobrunneus]